MVVIKLREILKERGMTQKELAQKCSLREATISQIARGNKGSINIEHLEKIAHGLEITEISDLLQLQSEENTNGKGEQK